MNSINTSFKNFTTLAPRCEYIRANVRYDGEVKVLADQAVERFGRVEVAFSDAGAEGKFGLMTGQTAADCAAAFDTKRIGCSAEHENESRVMLAQGIGNIVNASSVLGKIGTGKGCTYEASKHAVDGLNSSAALEFATA